MKLRGADGRRLLALLELTLKGLSGLSVSQIRWAGGVFGYRHFQVLLLLLGEGQLFSLLHLSL